ncbi:sensor histidine kinase [Actinomadura verrucosospora]|uniref:histidine kinase n=1 Tax=Actinomadura verrucosospora TaxID=46165 RepID=A0A7D4A0K1_ACTVE|nr:nitrate- and nitrite sensing domain-containing protein [Actinomadura verrucosospora]QKG22724.1 histidine kinase HAMP region domain-containing protein [Actinomadura verrucosospora]
MRFRNSRLRTKIAALLLSLTALWVFAAWVTLREGVNLLFVNTLDSVVAPSDPLLVDLQQERRLTVTMLASGRLSPDQLAAARARTDKDREIVVRKARSGAVRRAADGSMDKRLEQMVDQLASLDQERRSIDAGAFDRHRAVQAYSDVIESIFHMYDGTTTLDDRGFTTALRAEIAVNRSWELLSQEDAIVAGVLATGRITVADRIDIAQAIGARRLNYSRAMIDLEPADRQAWNELNTDKRLATVRAMEDVLLQQRTRTMVPRISADQWRAATTPALAQMRTSIQDAGDRLVERATPIAAWVIVRLVLAGGLGLLAVIASIVVSITTARALVRQLERLRTAAWELAEQRLPGVVERLGHGEKVDVSVEAPPLQFGTDEIGQVGRAFNAVQETAIRTAVEQAELRRGIRDVLLSLARRTQTLVHRQLTMLDTMERRRDIEVKELEELFRLDHLATRMRRNAENLIVLSGALPARGWRSSVPMIDVVRAAVGEVEDYTRVTVLPFGPVELAGRAVGDVTHLLAELIENAVSFSPPDTVVQVGGHLVANGFAIDIEDRGLGMTDEKLAEINARIEDPPDFNLQSSVQLGLFVVSRLAERYGLRVSLKRSAYGGTTAVVVVPTELVVEESDRVRAPAATTTQNGLEVRQPTAVGARSGGPAALTTGGTGPQPAPSAPALVAVPPPAPEPGETPVPPSGQGPNGSPERGLPRRQDEPPAGGARSHDGAPSTPPGHTGAGGGHPEPTQPEDLPPVPDISTTPSGLPVRVPQANLAEPLRTDEPIVAEEPDETDDPGRSPEEIQRIMGSYQRGTRRGRSDAAEALGNEAAEGEEGQ